MTAPIIYTSELLRTEQKTTCVAKAIFAALDKLHVEHRELKNTQDYWCRDYMPVMVYDDGTYAIYEYNPDYLVENKKWCNYITNQQDACKQLRLYAPMNMNIVFDGGNYVRCGNKVIMTDKIFSENPQWPTHELIQHLQIALCADIILLPWDMKDPCGHADGMVADLGDGQILLNGCWKKQDAPFHKRLRKILDVHFKVEELPAWDGDKDSWCYLNYLHIPEGILLPCLSENYDTKDDIAALKYFEQLFPKLEIIPIYARPLIKGKNGGGALHCVTWEYIERKDASVPLANSL